MKLAKQKSRVKDIQTDNVVQAHSDETARLTKTEVASSNITEMNQVMNKENRSPDKPPPSPENPTNSQKPKT